MILIRFLLLIPLLFLCSECLSAQQDTVPPLIHCKKWPTYNFSVSPCSAELSVKNLVDSITDDSGKPLATGLRWSCSGDGFPKDTLIKTYLIGIMSVDVWARDQAGNQTFKQCPVAIGNNSGGCEYGTGMTLLTPYDKPINGKCHLSINIANCVGDTFYTDFEDWALYSGSLGGGFGFLPVPGHGYEGQIKLHKSDDPLNGVTTTDVALINQYLLGDSHEAFDSPYKIIAADVNQDGKISAYDAVLLRRLVLGIVDTLPNNVSWRFMPKEYVFPNPHTPFFPPPPDFWSIHPSIDPLSYSFIWIGIKVGDINWSAE